MSVYLVYSYHTSWARPSGGTLASTSACAFIAVEPRPLTPYARGLQGRFLLVSTNRGIRFVAYRGPWINLPYLGFSY